MLCSVESCTLAAVTTLLTSMDSAAAVTEEGEAPVVDHAADDIVHAVVAEEFNAKRLSAFYRAHNPEKVGTVEATLAKYAGKEAVLFDKLAQKYGENATKPWLTEYYTEHNPDKMASIDATLAKYVGREEVLYYKLTKKYTAKEDAANKETATAAEATLEEPSSQGRRHSTPANLLENSLPAFLSDSDDDDDDADHHDDTADGGIDVSRQKFIAPQSPEEHEDATDTPVRRLQHRDSLRMVRMKGIENDIDLAGCELSDGESSSDGGDTGTDDYLSGTDSDNNIVPVRRLVHRDSKRILTDSIHRKKEDVEFLRALAAEIQAEEDAAKQMKEAAKKVPDDDEANRRYSFGIAPFPNMNTKLVPMKGKLTAAPPRPTTRLVWKDNVEWEYIENFRFALKKREKANVWFSDNEMIMIQVGFLDEQQAMERKQAQKDKHQKEANASLTSPDRAKKEKKKKKKKKNSSHDALSSNHVDRRVIPAKKKSSSGRRGLMNKAKSISNFFTAKESKPLDDIAVSRSSDRRNTFSRSASAKF